MEFLPDPVATVPFPSSDLPEVFPNLYRATGLEVHSPHKIAVLIGQDFFSWAIRTYSDWSDLKFRQEYATRVQGLIDDIGQIANVVQGVVITEEGFKFYPTHDRQLEISFYNDRNTLFSIRKASFEIDLQSIALKRLREIPIGQIDENWGLKQYFGTIYLLNGDVKRLDPVKGRLRSIGLNESDYTVFQGVAPSEIPKIMFDRMENWEEHKFVDRVDEIHRGQTACYMAHYKLIEDVKNKFDEALRAYHDALRSGRFSALIELMEKVRERATVLIFEDNVGFGRLNENKVELDKVGYKFTKSVRDLPRNWDFFYLMLMLHNNWGIPSMVTKYIKAFNYGVIIKAYAIKYTAFDDLFEKLRRIESDTCKLHPVDHHIAEVVDSKTPDGNKKFHAYATALPCCYREQSDSLVGGGNGRWQSQ